MKNTRKFERCYNKYMENGGGFKNELDLLEFTNLLAVGALGAIGEDWKNRKIGTLIFRDALALPLFLGIIAIGYGMALTEIVLLKWPQKIASKIDKAFKDNFPK
jgi:hypothetical protein